MNPRVESRSLLPLPRELRDYIYQYLLTGTFALKNPRYADIPSINLLQPLKRPAILFVSKSTYEEAKKILYRHGHFILRAGLSGSPLRPGILGNISVLTLQQLQDITIRLDVRVTTEFRYSRTENVESATTIINQLVRLDQGVQRKRCVVDLAFKLDWEERPEHKGTAGVWADFKNALRRLGVFKTVEVNMDYLQMRGWAGFSAKPFCELLVKEVPFGLGEGKREDGHDRLCFTYYPQDEQSGGCGEKY